MNGDDGEQPQPFRVRLPGFVTEEVGLGDLVTRMTYRLGVRPCGGCSHRADALNRRVVLTGGNK
jgi:hypothetical protein